MDFIRLLMRILRIQPGTALPVMGISAPLGSGYTVPVPPTGVLHSRDLRDCEPEMVRRYLLLAAEFAILTGRKLFITCTWRSSLEQMALYQQGRGTAGKIVTNIDGVHNQSRHNFYPSQAIDVCIDVQTSQSKVQVADWQEKDYAVLGPLCIKHGLVWGGSFKTIHDYPHIELPSTWS